MKPSQSLLIQIVRWAEPNAEKNQWAMSYAQTQIQFSSSTGNDTGQEQAVDVFMEIEDPEPGKRTVQADKPAGDR